MKYKAILMFVVVATIFATVAEAQYTPSLMPPRVAHPSASTASINATGGAIPAATETCSYFFTVPGNLNSFLSFCVTVNGNIASIQSPNGFDQIAQGVSAKAMAFATFRRGSRTTTGHSSIAETGARRFWFRAPPAR